MLIPSSSGSADTASSAPSSSHPLAPAQGMGTVDTAAWPKVTSHDLTQAILHTVVYADLFDYPLRVHEIHRYLIGYPASLAMVEKRLQQDSQLAERLTAEPPFWLLKGREHLAGLRRERKAFSQVLWQQAKRYARLVAAVPFVRMVSVTGSLAMNNVISPRDDIDLMIVTAENRVWFARGLVILIVHLARRSGVEICPNYVVAENHLELDESSLFVAHELAQLVPLHGSAIYHRLLECNAWMSDFLPNAEPHRAGADALGTASCRAQLWMESVLAGRLGDAVERWERERKMPRLRQLAERKGGTGTIFTPDLCKGHVDDHANAVRQRFAHRLAATGVLPPQGP